MKRFLEIISFGLYHPKPETLGPVQKQWVAALRAHPERQGVGSLGFKYSEDNNSSIPYRACCLGEGGLIAGVCKWTESGALQTIDGSNESLLRNNTYEALGLYHSDGGACDGHHPSLAALNDNGTTWIEIADILETYPTRYFKHRK